jgi:DNA-binding transcriptional LysR family regulator
MDPRSLLHLAEIVDLGSFSRAAAVLHVTQPTLSRTIKQLEDRVGAPLLRRGRYGVTPTSVGEQLAQQGRAIRTSIGDAQSGIREWRSGLDHELRVGAGAMVALALLPRFLEKAIGSGWKNRLRFGTEAPNRLIEALQAREFDLVLAPAELYFRDDALIQRPAFSDSLGVYAGRNHPLARAARVGIADLAQHEWLGIGTLSRFRGTTGEIMETIGASGIRTRIEFSGNVATPIELLRGGHWVGIIPDFLGSFLPGAEDLVRLPLTKQLPSRDVAFWYRRDMAEHPQLMRFCALFTDFVLGLSREPMGKRRHAGTRKRSGKSARC